MTARTKPRARWHSVLPMAMTARDTARMLVRLLSLITVFALACASTQTHANARLPQPETAHRAFATIEETASRAEALLIASCIKANGHPEEVCASAQRLYGNNSPYKFTDPDGRAGIMVAPIVVAAVIVAGGYYVLTHMPANTGSSQSDGLSGLLGTSNTLPIFTKQLNEATTPEGQTGDAEEPEFTDVEGNKAPWQGEPGSTVRAGMGSRTYGGDGYPVTDRERGHPDEDGCGSEEHCHDWGRPEGGGKVTHGDRGPPRVPQPGDPPSPRGPNVPPPDPMIPEGI